MKEPHIVFKVWENGGNYQDVETFLGEQPPCPLCNDSGEYYDDSGFHGCQACSSRCFAFIDYRGKRVHADDGDTIWRDAGGRLHLIENLDNF